MKNNDKILIFLSRVYELAYENVANKMPNLNLQSKIFVPFFGNFQSRILVQFKKLFKWNHKAHKAHQSP
jgi:hypothetical protein